MRKTQINEKKVQIMEKLLKNVKDYFEYLARECRLLCSLHFSRDSHARLCTALLTELAGYMVHSHPYCNLVKASGHHPICMQNQKNIIASLSGCDSITHTCHGGVLEIAYPVRCEEKHVSGFVAVSGYRANEDANGVRIYNGTLFSTLRAAPPPRALTDTLIPPLCMMIERLVESTADDEESEFKQILGYLAENHTHVTLSEIAAHFHRSRSHVSHLFKTNAGVSLRAWCNDLRLSDAKHLLRSTELSVTEIAYEVGFEDASYFIKLFREKFGVSPRKFRS